ncbi:hypothetical protein F4824DRAFT_496922 [Ustulina deusta]|nr:hypothetical protein F4824DRAFT_496922 [Ustulina deusta]
MVTYYNLDNAISSFFKENTTVTRQQCEELALSRVGGQANPVETQGAFSYTFATGINQSKIFQFRTHDSEFDMSVINLAQTVHSQFIAGCKYHGTIGQSRPLHIYEMDKLPGATFFAQSWNHSQQLLPGETSALLAEFHDKFDLLHRSLPFRFASNLDRVRKELPLLFSKTLSFVLSHQDLCEINILIDPETGSITGIIDWADARILPFGFSLWAFENILGCMNSEGWHYYDNRHELQRIFWETFRMEAKNLSDDDLRLIQITRMAGLFCRYGFILDGKVCKGVIDESDVSSFHYLDAFCAAEDWELPI